MFAETAVCMCASPAFFKLFNHILLILRHLQNLQLSFHWEHYRDVLQIVVLRIITVFRHQNLLGLTVGHRCINVLHHVFSVASDAALGFNVNFMVDLIPPFYLLHWERATLTLPVNI